MNLGLPQRRAIACAAILVILIVWVLAVSSLAALIPDNALLKLAFYAIGGIGWCLPVVPVIAWSENDKPKDKGGK